MDKRNSTITMKLKLYILLMLLTCNLYGATGSGGIVTNYTENGTNFTAHIFLTNENFVVSGGNIVADVLVVAGGGDGGAQYGSGGGGGGVVEQFGRTITVGVYTAEVGFGGCFPALWIKTTDGADGTNGYNSTFDTIVALGGAGGRTYKTLNRAGANGGSGSGGEGATTIGAHNPAGTNMQTNSGGGTGYGNMGGLGSDYMGGGGGGAGSAGADGGHSPGVAIGGLGHTNSFSGISVSYGRGGDGRYATSSGDYNTENTGKGGEGYNYFDGSYYGQRGGSGIVVIRYETPTAATTTFLPVKLANKVLMRTKIATP